jgi:hypothetical protein
MTNRNPLTTRTSTIPFTQFSAEQIAPAIDTLLMEASNELEALKKVSGARTFANTSPTFLRLRRCWPHVRLHVEGDLGRKGTVTKNIAKTDRAAIRAQKGEYWNQAGGRPLSYGSGYRILAYLAYQLPVSFIEFEHLLHDLAVDGLLRERMRVLDLGSGPGTVPLAITDAWGRGEPS